jgi:hypothetical protein
VSPNEAKPIDKNDSIENIESRNYQGLMKRNLK